MENNFFEQQTEIFPLCEIKIDRLTYSPHDFAFPTVTQLRHELSSKITRRNWKLIGEITSLVSNRRRRACKRFELNAQFAHTSQRSQTNSICHAIAVSLSLLGTIVAHEAIISEKARKKAVRPRLASPDEKRRPDDYA